MFDNKRGSLADIVFMGIVLLFGGMVILLGFRIQSGVNDTVQSMAIMPTEATTASTTLTNYYPGIINKMYLILAIGMGLVTLVLAALVRVHPIFIPFYFIGLVIVVFISGVFSNIYQEMAANTNLVTYANQLTFLSGILNVLPMIVGIFGVLLMVVMYKLWSVGE